MGQTAVRYLLYVTVGLVALDVVVDIGSIVPIDRLTLIVAGALVLASAIRYVGPESEIGARALSPSVRQPSDRTVAIILLGLLVAGGMLRAYALGAQSFWFDEAISTNAAIAVLETGRPTFPSGYTYWRAFPQTLVMAGSMAVFGTGEAAARAPSVVFGVATIGVTYWLGREVGGPRVGLLAAALVTFATWEIAWSRQARMYQLFQLSYVLALVLLLRVERTWFGDKRSVVALAAVSVLAALTHQIGYVLLPIAVAYLGLTGLIDGRLSGRIVGSLLVGSLVLLFAVEFVTSGFTGAIESVSTTDVDYQEAYTDWLVEEFHAFVYLAVVGSALTFYRGRYRSGTLLVLAVAPAAWILSFHTELFASRYLYFVVPVLFLWAAVTVDFVAVGVADRGRAIGDRLLDADSSVSRADGGTATACVACSVAIASVVLLGFGGGFTVTPHAEYELGPNAPQPEFADAYEYVNEHRESGDVIVAGWTATGVYYAGGVDYWLAHDLTGSGGNWTVDGVDQYAGAEPIRSADDLEAVMDDNERGWIVVDEMALARQPHELRSELEAMPNYRSDSVYVFHWDGDD
ncbi:glycosyltransferase family 39 protein [Halosolutus halophilus]|uniref:glycosyltransferase family 39 protein n=1 Tax=Halosolutus halophilus TaxID=1552990 RepID=UPI002234FDE0|nr:glycosyltransferase family 39 protein [Halosolutus halophilus]